LDLHFHPSPSKRDILAAVSSTGTISIFRLDPVANLDAPLQHLASTTPPDVEAGVLFLSCAWHPTVPELLAITLSTGQVCLVQLSEDYQVSRLLGDNDAVITHSLEAWTVAFGTAASGSNHPPGSANPGSRSTTTGNPVTIYSGGDDSTLRYTSYSATLEEGGHENSDQIYPVLQLPARSHSAGITAILPLPVQLSDGSDVVVTGSYDDHMRVFAIKSPATTFGARVVRDLAEQNLGGGVWRLKLIDVQCDDDDSTWRATILASCMHAGSRVVEVSGSYSEGDCVIEVLGRFEEHKSMNYGSDFVPGTETSELQCVSTSFYDKLLCVWSINIRAKDTATS
jgi:diphthine methyl ester acylhydrolase